MAELKVVVPSSDDSFDKRCALVLRVVSQKMTGGDAAEWKHIPVEKVTELSDAFSVWSVAFAKMAAPHTPVETVEKNTARKAVESILRKFIQRFFYDADDVVSNADLESMELPIRDRTYTRHGRPDEHVKLETRPHMAAEIRIDYRCEETGNKSKPKSSYKGLVLYWNVLESGEEIPMPEQLKTSRLITRTPHIQSFDNSLRGRRVAFSGAWENGSGMEGSRCPCVIGIIP
ncbi:MAG: hypothetical protein LBJ41_12155 [Treponema sp.]|jgi:hypothetical protein|nr:hypothetical protein [Treponema sp.]